VLAVLFLGRYAWLPYRTDHVLFDVDARTAVAQSEDSYKAIPAARDAIARLDTIPGAGRISVNYHMLYAANDRLLQRWDDARRHYDAALALDRRPEVYFQRGELTLERGNIAAALPDLVLATRFSEVYADGLEGELRKRVRREAGFGN
jgi:tetratricopeptide (TPR) repeat protein